MVLPYIEISKYIFLHRLKLVLTLSLKQIKNLSTGCAYLPTVISTTYKQFYSTTTQVSAQGETNIYQYLLIEIIFGYWEVDTPNKH